MTTREILVGARALIARRGGWTKGSLENRRTGSVCAIGALSKFATGRAQYGHRGCYDAERRLERVMGNGICSYNDSKSKKCVLAAFDAAIEKAEM